MITDDAGCTRGIKSSIAMTKIAFNQKESPVTNKLDFP
jgi:hypothetical protein